MKQNPGELLKKFGKGSIGDSDKGLFMKILKIMKLDDAAVLWHVATHPSQAAKIFKPGDIALIIAAVFYVVSPIDAIPDWLPVVGFLDDATVVLFVVNKLREYLNSYKQKFI